MEIKQWIIDTYYLLKWASVGQATRSQGPINIICHRQLNSIWIIDQHAIYFEN